MYGTLDKGVLYYGSKSLEIENWRRFSQGTMYWIIALGDSGIFNIIKGIKPNPIEERPPVGTHSV